MAWESLADFFAVYHGCDDWTLQKAVTRCAAGRYGESLRKAAQSWRPEIHKHKTLRLIMLAAGDTALEFTRTRGRQTTAAVTRVRKELEAWLCEHGYPLPEPPAPQPLQIDTLWDILNATSRYSKEDIKGAVCIAMYGDYGDNDAWKPALQAEARWRQGHTQNAWERELIGFMLAKAPADPRPQPRTTCMYNQAKRIRAYLRKSSAHSSVRLAAEPWRAADGRPRRTERTYG
jgi:hypothetical protein